ncbi:unnamed protein product [Paramecium octaurelia]|uniref:Uncharacterized protein n=1 Tax=Paramecium octaurelia TaxID=43137 RepID=A0A8S1YRN0_PAROT|nr:unnamed protein product [Paramecium octaurelia]
MRFQKSTHKEKFRIKLLLQFYKAIFRITQQLYEQIKIGLIMYQIVCKKFPSVIEIMKFLHQIRQRM